MIVTADLDLSESGQVGGRPEQATVLIYAADKEGRIADALAAIGRCRLILEGHAYDTTILWSVSAAVVSPHMYPYRMGEDGEVWGEAES